MFTLNPLQNPDALWQHIVMVLVAAILGYIIGYIGAKQKEKELDRKLAKLNADLEMCLTIKRPVVQTTVSASPEPVNLVKPVDFVKKDDLKIIEGIGPKIEELLNSEGIFTFEQLKEASSEHLTAILQKSGNRFQVHDPQTWPHQASLAANQMWDQLKELQNELNKGRWE